MGDVSGSSNEMMKGPTNLPTTFSAIKIVDQKVVRCHQNMQIRRTLSMGRIATENGIRRSNDLFQDKKNGLLKNDHEEQLPKNVRD